MQRLANKKILIVEDDDMLRETLTEVISAHGAIISEAENGTIAFDLIQNDHFDAVLSDIRMPGGGGVALAKQMAGLVGAPPLFFCSGFNDLKDEHLDQLNVAAVFEKPFNLEAMIQQLEETLQEG